jgi:two-component system nitrate/nitrite response regulator NarL
VTGTVLIVDDDPGFRRVAGDLLADRGYRVVGEAGTVEAGLALVADLEPDAVLCDVNLPDGDGASLAARCSDGSTGPRVLLTSSDPSAAPTRVVQSCGAAGFVAKTALTETDFDRYLKR